ncbi:diheme cytochrome c-553 [Pontibacter sp. E15-1]|uniref:diheme cytochrome c-553 n=1 Tax=Pontibacter sp. E15-1 TaxID=2919918 RepID=UPI001F4F1F8A|nr:diheme cytochrome c-553 [Pontibacter sp. E15-1]MCJ8164170.1 diheme cytochrome c-553 [Pontibacter sp. E15-1]
MKSKLFILSLLVFAGVLLYLQHARPIEGELMQQAGFIPNTQSVVQQQANGGFESQIKYGEHLVFIAGCHDCHTPKKMTDKGPAFDMSRALSGHPAQEPIPDVNREEMERKGYSVTQTLTAWVGPWGVSYAANLTSDKTGIGNWQEKNFFTAIRQGKHKGIVDGRELLPPMP